MNLNVANAMADARTAMTENAFQQAASAASDARSAVREESQARTATEIKGVIDKLQSGDRLTDQELTLVRAWVVGDAESYTKMENSFQEWLSEYDRLEQVLAGYETKECSPDELTELVGILEDAARISYDIANFLEKKDRIGKFNAAVSDGLNDRERELLVGILTNSLHSSDY